MSETTKPNYDNLPFIAVPKAANEFVVGWDKIAAQLQAALTKTRAPKPILVVECQPGVDEVAVLNELQTRLAPKLTIHAAESYHSPERIDKLVAPFLAGDHPEFGRVYDSSLVTFFDAEPLWRFRRTIDELKGGLVLIVGCGASLIAWGDLLVHASLAPREAQQRLQQNESCIFGANNQALSANLKHKRARFVDWPVADRWKRPLIKRWDYVLDTHTPHEPQLASAEDVRLGLEAATKRPLRLVPFSNLNSGTENYGLRLDCVPNESSLLLGFSDQRLELPATDLFFNQPRALLGEAVYARFGDEFPIRFDLKKLLANHFEPLIRGDGWRQERMSSPENQFIEIRRHWFNKTTPHHTHGGLNVLNLVQGDEAIVGSPTNAFEPFVVHHAETFIVPAAVGRYTIRPHGPSVGQELATVKAFVRPVASAPVPNVS